MACFTQFKYAVWKSILVIVMSHIMIWLLNYYIFETKGFYFFAIIFPLSLGIPVFICFRYLSRSNGYKVLFSLLTVMICGMMKGYVAALLFLNLHDKLYLRLSYEFWIFALMFTAAFIVLRKPYLRIFETFDKGWGLISIVPGLLFAILYLLQYYPTFIVNRSENNPIILLVYFLSIAFYAILYHNFESIFYYYQLKQDKKVMMMQVDIQKKKYETMLDSVNLNKIYRHDMKHHLYVISNFLNDKNIIEARNYISKLENKLDETIVQKYCENYGLNVILSAYINKAMREDIEVISEIYIPEEISIDIVDLGAIFANAIENAITACKKIENPSNRKITIICKEHFDHIYLRISNPYIGEVLFDGEYPVSEKANHGLGTKSIASIAEKQGGVFSFTAQDGIFNTTVTLKYT